MFLKYCHILKKGKFMNFLHKIPLFFFSLVYPCKFYGKENIPKGSAVLVSNHFSALDCGYIAKLYSKDIYFLAKKEIFKNKLFAKIVKSYGGIPIDRDKPDIKALFSATKVLKDGHKLAIFPEGTRNKTGTNQLQPIKGGSVIFAVKAKCPIVPMMILKKAKFLSRNKMIIGKPFYLEEFYDKQITPDLIEKMDKIVETEMLNQQRILLDMVNCKVKK